jgi:tetratricopeptide (TPR) repeat protein
VQIRDVEPPSPIVGTGVVVSARGHVVTCAHVVKAARVNPELKIRIRGVWEMLLAPFAKRPILPPEVLVVFPELEDFGRREMWRRATVKACLPEDKDDVVLLELTKPLDDVLPGEQVALLGPAKGSTDHKFKSYGYRRVDKYWGLRTKGTIIGDIDNPAGVKLLGRRVQLESAQIDRGMSGAAVFDPATDRNAVVGLIVETCDSRGRAADQFTNFAVDCKILELDPFNLPVHEGPYPLRPAPESSVDPRAARAKTVIDPGVTLHGAPPVTVWVGRESMLQALDEDWDDPTHRVTGLIGFGGEGKSSLARHGIDHIQARGGGPDGVFWWTYREGRHDVERFFGAALTYLTGGAVDPGESAPGAAVQLIAAMLGARRYLFVLDGLEAVQRQRQSHFGKIENTALRDLVGFFAVPNHESRCLITSRVPIDDLAKYITYKERSVSRLSTEEGIALLLDLGVKGPVETMRQVVDAWDGHALTLTLLAGYLLARPPGDISRIAEIPAPTSAEPLYDRIARLLGSYDDHLGSAEQIFLMIFGAFRTLVSDAALRPVFRPPEPSDALAAPLSALTDEAFEELVQNLVSYRLLRHDPARHGYSTHPLIRAHYLGRLTSCPPAQVRALHARIRDYYLAIARDELQPTLTGLARLVEAVHHACLAAIYDEAYRIYRERLEGPRKVLSSRLKAYDTIISLMHGFFPDGDISREPLVSDPEACRYILNLTGVCNRGRLGEEVPLFERAIRIAERHGLHKGVVLGNENLVEVYSYLGPLEQAADAARRALELAPRLADKSEEALSWAYSGWVAHLRGRSDEASEAFDRARTLQQEAHPERPHLWSLTGIWHADHLRRTTDPASAGALANAILAVAKAESMVDDISQAHRLLGDVAAAMGDSGEARDHHDEAIRVARTISERTVLLEGLLARGRAAATAGEVAAARLDLHEALAYALNYSYHLYEADCRVGLAWVHHHEGDNAAARAEATQAIRQCDELGYYWGRQDANTLLELLAASERTQ